MESLGQNITSANQFFEIASKLILPLRLEKDIKSFKDARFILKLIEAKEDSHLSDQISFNNDYSKNGKMMMQGDGKMSMMKTMGDNPNMMNNMMSDMMEECKFDKS